MGKRIRHLQRYREIVTAFVRYGFGYIVKRLGLLESFPMRAFRFGERRDLEERTIGERIRLFLEELGPTFVKLGQIASTRPDLLPADIIAELVRLQDKVAPFPFEEVERIVTEELGEPLEQLFAQFRQTPLAAASIGQVHYAVLRSGEQVAVKVQRPGIRPVVDTDLEILEDLARMAESRLDWAKQYRIRDVVEELARALRLELDYGNERRNAEKFAAQGAALPFIHIPAIHWELSTGKVLTMEFIDGIQLSERERLDAAGFNRRTIAERLVQAILHQALIEGFFHGDPHPGNVLALPDGRLALIDFGMAGRLSPELKMHVAAFVLALRSQNASGILRAVLAMGLVPEDAETGDLLADIETMRDKYYNVPLARINLGEAVNDLFSLAFRHDIRMPADLTLLGKSLLTMEGVVTSLDPSFSVIDAAEPFGKRLLMDKFNPNRLAKRLLGKLPEYIELLTDVPLRIKDLTALARKGKFKLEISIPELDRFMSKMDRVSNRLSFSVVLLAFSMIMVGLMIGSSVSTNSVFMWRFPVIEIGFGIAALMFLWLIYSIFRSGRF
ncbi:ABC1 kinase family protein [Paenibacillus cymbidii]|uniref:ABC1 kinase family protein n=1 Tax=Paenibacillus cymbidii TaxID=1639034 RepID=UPI0010814F53|nr:AarF/ABC1/UbiB kinase family protein [Paenibacillus cymbidii]